MESARAESLLAYLLLHRDVPQPRQRLAFLLWPDSTEQQARTNLRHVLHNLRRALPEVDAHLEVTPRTLLWRSGAETWLDVAAFEAALEKARGADEVAALREAAQLYDGDLLAGSYDEWVLDERERLRAACLDALARLVVLLEQRGEVVEARGYAERLLRLDPLREETTRALMRLHAARGDAPRALRAYHACVATLERELGVEPSAATRAVYEALLMADAPATPGDAQRGGLPLVGRATELSLLAEEWRRSQGGRAHFVALTGEPGVGKTRLVEELRAWCAQRGARTAEARSYAAEGALPYGQVIAWLRSDALGESRARLDAATTAELAALLPELGDEPPRAGSAEDRRQRLFDAVARTLLDAGSPLLLVADDLQWADRDSVALLHYLLRTQPDAPLLVAATVRREDLDDQQPLSSLLAALTTQGRCTQIAVGRLGHDATAALAERVTGQRLDAATAVALHAETEGNPLFVIEAVRAGWEPGRPGAGITPRVEAVIAARLAQLSAPAREVVGLAAAIGRAFTADVLMTAGQGDAGALVHGLDELWRRGLIDERGADGYDFSHGNIREVAYAALSPARRRDHHVRIARALVALHDPDPDSVSGELAAHFEAAGALERAARWYLRAAAASMRLYAEAEAVRQLDRGLAVVAGMPGGGRRDDLELEFLAALPSPLVALDGFWSPPLARVHERALALAASRGVEPVPPLLRSLAGAALAHDDLAAAERFGHALVERADREHDDVPRQGDGGPAGGRTGPDGGGPSSGDVLRVEGHYVLGMCTFWTARLSDALHHFESAVASFRDEHRATHLAHYGQDPQVYCLARLGYTLWFVGRADEATRTGADAAALGQRIGHPYSLSLALTFVAFTDMEAGDHASLRRHVVELDALPVTRQAPHMETGLEALWGYLDVIDGRAAAGTARIREQLDRMGQIDRVPRQRAAITRVLLAACEAAGHADAGFAAAERLLNMYRGANPFEAEALRMRGAFRAQLGEPRAEALADVERAVRLAHSQGAVAFERRAAATLRELQRPEERVAERLRNGARGRSAHDQSL